ncbi:MAG: hypothetical protein NTV01_05165 [Bacteroidia bacterium]|nr:hypothetical protein [Bacteroidia bacterium]
MKINFIAIILIGLALGIGSKIDCQTQSKNLPDTLVLRMKQEKGRGLLNYRRGINDLIFRSLDSLGFEVILPDNITDIGLRGEVVDYDAYAYHRITKEQKASPYWKGMVATKKVDPLNPISLRDNSVCFLTGMRGKDPIFIIDQNNNKDFRDDPVRQVETIDLYSREKLIPCDYKIYNGKKYVTATNWLAFGTWRDDGLWYAAVQHFTTGFNLEKSSYEIELFISESRFYTYRPQLAVIGGNGILKDTVAPGEYVGVGEFILLKEGVYRFADLTQDCSYITLVREDHYADKSGTQIGVLAPAFKCHTTDGDSISSEDYKGSNVLLVNISACYSVPGSQEVYKDLAETYGSKLDMVVIDRAGGYLKQIEKWNLAGKLVNADTPDNKEFAKNYRSDYCSRTCFLIGPDGRIVDKFEIFNWEKNLAKHFKNL